VSKGQVIAELGDTGNATGPHLHFEIRQNDRALDPLQYLP
jgi:murein DD-endopeptidase MepM/ murein hydrolase activator NlpD